MSNAEIHHLLPLLSFTVSLFAFCVLMTCMLMRPSARRTILLTTPLSKKKEKKKKSAPKQDSVNPIYMWMVQPKEETGLREGFK